MHGIKAQKYDEQCNCLSIKTMIVKLTQYVMVLFRFFVKQLI